MPDIPTREQLAESCDQLAAALAAPRSLEIDDAHRVAIEQALARVRAQLLGGDEAALVVALVGGTGVGKSFAYLVPAILAVAQEPPQEKATADDEPRHAMLDQLAADVTELPRRRKVSLGTMLSEIVERHGAAIADRLAEAFAEFPAQPCRMTGPVSQLMKERAVVAILPREMLLAWHADLIFGR